MYSWNRRTSDVLFNDTSVPLAIVSSVIRGIGMSPFYGGTVFTSSDAIEYGQWKTGKQN